MFASTSYSAQVSSPSFRPRFRRQRRGGILITALVFSVVIAFLLAGIGTFTVSHLSRESTEASYTGALDIAEAGVNYELRKISSNASNADQYSSTTQSGATYSLGSGSYTVYCENTDGSTPWVAPNPLYIICTGTLNGVSRSIKVMCEGFASTAAGNYAIYAMNGISTWNGTALSVTGDVGTNALLSFSGSPGITGTVYFNGPGAGWLNIGTSGYTTRTNSQPIAWPTVDQIALAKFPNSGATAPGGLSYLATHNSNANASPAISGNSIVTSTTLVGPGDYYLTNISLHGTQTITLDNTNGPINIWLGPDGGSGNLTFVGGSAAVARSSDPTKACTIYCATAGGVTLKGNSEMDATVYAYNTTVLGVPYGYIDVGGTPAIYGQVLGNQVDIHGNVSITWLQGEVAPTNYENFTYYGFANSWQEQSGM